MATTDYKEKYEAALERCKKLYNEAKTNEYTSDIEDYETIFPELKESKESEDEKIRKTISDILLIDSDEIREILDANNISIQDIDTWLEKQGKHANFRNKIQVGDKVTRNKDGVLINLSQLKRVAKPSEKQGEQKETLCDNDKKELKKKC